MGKPHEQLDAWKVSMTLVKSIYDMTAAFPVGYLALGNPVYALADHAGRLLTGLHKKWTAR